MSSRLAFFIYRTILIPISLVLLSLLQKLSLLPKKIMQMCYDRQDAWPIIQANTDKKPIWIHAASGEIEYAKPLIRELTARLNQPLLITYFSPSALKLLPPLRPIDVVMPLPWDSKRNAQRFLKHFQPQILLIARTDLWPEFIYQTQKQNIPCILFAASGHPHSWFSQALMQWTWSCLQSIYCVSDDDMKQFIKLKAKTHLQVGGDTRYDQVLWRLQNPKACKESLRPQSGFVLIAGSTWPADEAVLLPCLPEFISTGGKVILVPHETNLESLQKLQNQLHQLKLSHQLYSQAQDASAHILIVDQVGILPEIYAWGDVAFVGGSFKDKVHSVMEPLAAGLPVLVGPWHHNNCEALLFKKTPIGQLSAVKEVKNSQDLVKTLKMYHQQLPLIANSKLLVQNHVQAQAGATAMLIQQIERQLSAQCKMLEQ